MNASTRGRVDIVRHSSQVLRGNPLGDPVDRDLYCYLPPGYDESHERYPVIYFLAGFTGRGKSHFQLADAWAEPLDARLDRLIASGEMPPIICVNPDCFTSFGGSQYADSSATGKYERYVTEELVAFVDERFRTRAGRDHRGVTGKSSGGYGALRLAMRHPDVFGALGSHAGDAYFAYCYLPDFPKLVLEVGKHGGTVENFWRWFQSLPKKTSEALTALNILAMAACYSPNPKEPLGIELPMKIPSGDIRADVWQRWVENDPVHMAPRHADALRSMRRIYLDAGLRDEYNLQLGARILCEKFAALGVSYMFEEFDDTHGGILYRYDRSLVELSKNLL